jgi:hypothetical protein
VLGLACISGAGLHGYAHDELPGLVRTTGLALMLKLFNS